MSFFHSLKSELLVDLFKTEAPMAQSYVHNPHSEHKSSCSKDKEDCPVHCVRSLVNQMHSAAFGEVKKGRVYVVIA